MVRDRLSKILGPTVMDKFLCDIYGKEHSYMPGESDRFQSLLTWRRLDSLLSTARLNYPQLRLAREGEIIDSSSYMRYSKTNRGAEVARVDHALLTEHFKNGATLVISAIDELDEAVEDLAIAIESTLRVRVSVNLYASYGEKPGFTNHWDDHDALVFQLEGSKEWAVYGMSRRWPLFRDVESTPVPRSAPLARYVATPGDILYIPRGYWHEANPTNGTSLHLTFGFMRPTGVDFISWLSDSFRAREEFRVSVPHYASEEFAKYETNLLRLLRQELCPGILREFLRDRDAAAPARTSVNLLWGLDPIPTSNEFTCRILTPRAYIQENVELPGKHALHAGGKRLLLSNIVMPLTRLLLDGEWHSHDEVFAQFGDHTSNESVLHLVRQLHSEGLIAVRHHRDKPANVDQGEPGD